ncbi:hypothetical protein ACF07T_40050 [Streptomyces sp. NPDC015184]|uniref:hypothetical protein n=1 Tax=Streptomyces sp. NPDC015184 TaxID=3364946 RepID=UPI0036FAD567
MQTGLLACMTTPAQGNVIPDNALYACDNGKFGKGWPGASAWFAWLAETLDRYGRERCLWALAPDVPTDAEATLAESAPWLEGIRGLGIRAAFAAQDGSEHGLVPWESFDVLFLAGSTAWKTGPAAHRLALQARSHGLDVHMDRVNSRRRLRIAQDFGCTSCDGTCLSFGPAINLPRLLAWMNELHAAPTAFGDST